MDLPPHLRYLAATQQQPNQSHVFRMASMPASIAPHTAMPFSPREPDASASPSFFGGQQLSQMSQQAVMTLCSKQSLTDDSIHLHSITGAACSSMPSTSAHPLSSGAPCFGGQLSQQAMLVGTVAALSEESGQLRMQWKSDVARLESELQELRNAAAWALPRLGQESSASSMQPMMAPGSGYSPRGTPVSSAADGMQHTEDLSGGRISRGRSPGPRPDQGRLSDVAVQMHNEIYSARGQHQFPVASSSNSRMPGESAELVEMIRTLGATEVTACVRAAHTGSCASLPQSSPGDSVKMSEAIPARGHMSCVPECQTRAVVDCSPRLSDRVMQMHNDMHNAQTRAVIDCAAEMESCEIPELPEICFSRGTPGLSQQVVGRSKEMRFGSDSPTQAMPTEMMQELERLERALHQSQQEVATLKEEKAAAETAHSRDVSALETMLQQVLAENSILTKRLAAADDARDDTRSLRSVSEPDKEAQLP